MTTVKTILFRGGMIGDLLIGMIDQSSLEPLQNIISIEDSTCVDYKINSNRVLMKKFFRYNQEEKDLYYKDLEKFNDNLFVLSHDTDYCLEHRANSTVQIICSDESKLENFAIRFKNIHRHSVVKEAANAINGSVATFVRDYTDSIILWQQHFQFKNRFDIKNVSEPEFYKDVSHRFCCDELWCSYLYKKWLLV